jgi:perosamine synthetase
MSWQLPHARFRLYTRPRDYWALLRDVVSGRAATGDDIGRLEQALTAWSGAAAGLCLPQARLGVYLAVKGLIRPGQRVVLSPYTIADVVNMVLCAGGVPVFADIDRASTNVGPDAIAPLIDERTGAVLVTHLHGIACDIESVAALCAARGVPLIEDAAQAFGARVNGRPVGSFGDVGIYSFGMYKSVTAFYGGALVARRPEVVDVARAELQAGPYMPLGRLGRGALKACLTDITTSPLLFGTLVYWLFRFGYLHYVHAISRFVTTELDTSRRSALPPEYLVRMLPVQARMVLRQLGDVDEHAAVRRAYARIYHQGLRDIDELLLPPLREDGSCVYNYFPVQYRDRKALVRWMMREGRDVAVQHLKNCAALESFAAEARSCPNAALTADQVVLLPNYPTYGEKDVRANIASIRRFFETEPGRRGPA